MIAVLPLILFVPALPSALGGVEHRLAQDSPPASPASTSPGAARELPPDATAREVEQRTYELYSADLPLAQRAAILEHWFDACRARPALHTAAPYVASILFYLETDLTPERFEALSSAILAAARGPGGRESFWWLMDRVDCDLTQGRWHLAHRGLERAEELLGSATGLDLEYRRVFFEGYRATLLTLMARFTAAAAAAEATQHAERAFRSGVAEAGAERAREELGGESDQRVLQAWRLSALVELALALARTELAETVAIHARLTQSDVYARLDRAQRAELALRVAMAEVEGLRRGELADVDPVARLAALAEDLAGHGRDRFRALWWWGRALVDQGRSAEARARVAELYEHLAQHPEWSRLELLAVALEARVAREGDPLELARVLPRLDSAFARFLTEWSRAPLDEGGTGYLSFEEWNMIASELLAAHDRAAPGGEGARRGLERILAAQACGTLARRLGAPPIDLERVRAELLSPDEGALLYWFGREQLHLFVIDRERVEHVPLAADFAVDRARVAYIAALDAAVGGGSLTDLERTAADFAALVLPPPARAAMASWGGVAIVGLDAIGSAPFELLPCDGEHLGNVRALRYLPSFALASALRARGQARSMPERELLALVAPECGIAEEARAAYAFSNADAKRLWGRYHASRVLRGAGQATVDAYSRLRPGEYRVVHWIVHGERDPYRPRPGGLRLYGTGSDPEILWAADLERAGAGTLAILTACEAGRVPLRRGDDGVAHLGSAFLLGGSSSVLFSHVRIGLAPSLAPLAAFHRELAAGARPAHALLAARRAARTPLERLNAGLMHLVGLDEPLFAPNPPDSAPRGVAGNARVIGLGIGLGLAALVLWALRRRVGT